MVVLMLRRLFGCPLVLMFVVTMCVVTSEADAREGRPNILFIYLDDFGWKDTGYMGSDFYETPNIDRLAAEGMVFTDAYSAAANCAPARACLLSGQYTPRHRIFNVGTQPRGKSEYRKLEHIAGTDTLDPKIRTWAHQLQQAGYVTASIGKWHLSSDPRPYGFDVNVGGTHSGSPPRGYYPPHNKAPGLEDAPPDEYLTDRLSNEAIHFVRENRDQRWAICLSHFAVHTPLHARRDLVGKYEDKPKGTLHSHVAMATMIEAVDEGIGRIIRVLEDLALSENTVIIFSSDNGGYGPATDMAPLKGYKGTYYEGGIREPFFVKWPGVVRPGTVSAEPIIAVDLYPTLCDIAGVEVPSGQLQDGVSLVPLLNGSKSTFGDRPLYWHFPAYLQAYQVWDEQRDPLFRSRPCSIIRSGPWKLHHYFEDNQLELYNLQDDIAESRNLAASQPDVANRLLARLEAWRTSTAAPIPQKQNPDYDAAAEADAIAKKSRRDRAVP